MDDIDRIERLARTIAEPAQRANKYLFILLLISLAFNGFLYFKKTNITVESDAKFISSYEIQNEVGVKWRIL